MEDIQNKLTINFIKDFVSTEFCTTYIHTFKNYKNNDSNINHFKILYRLLHLISNCISTTWALCKKVYSPFREYYNYYRFRILTQ